MWVSFAVAALAQEPTDAVVLGDLDRSLIDDVIKGHMTTIRDCYQRELIAHDGVLGGKLVMKFTIAKDGAVSAADVKSSTLADPDVDTCMIDVFKSMQFPSPTGGGIVIVSYPFLFSPSIGLYMPGKLRRETAPCLEGVTPLANNQLLLALHKEERRYDDAQVLMAEVLPVDTSACMVVALEDNKPPLHADGWFLYAVR